MVQDLLYAVADVPLILNPHARGTANAKKLLSIREAIADVEAYAQLNDTVLSLIDNSPLITNDARCLLDRFKTRQHYRLCGKVGPWNPTGVLSPLPPTRSVFGIHLLARLHALRALFGTGSDRGV